MLNVEPTPIVLKSMLAETAENMTVKRLLQDLIRLIQNGNKSEFSQYLTHNLEQLILPTSFPKPLPNSQKNSSPEDVDSFSLNISLEKMTTEENNKII